MMKLRLLILDCLYPNRCGCCKQRIAYDRTVCSSCSAELEQLSAGYARWAESKTEKDISWDDGVSAFLYSGAARKGVLSMKEGDRNFAEFSAEKLAETLRLLPEASELSFVTWVPITKKRRRMQGFCHAELLAEAVAEKLHLPARGDLLTEDAGRIRQHQMGGIDRTRYAERFQCGASDLSDQTILLCDDVLTTGSTLRHCTCLLKERGAKRVIIAAAAVRIREKKQAEP